MTVDSKNVLIWDPDHMYELNLAYQVGLKLFGDAEVINNPDPYSAKNDHRKKVVVRNWWAWNGGNNQSSQDLSWADLVICYTSELINGPWESFYKMTSAHFNNNNLICVASGRYNLHHYPVELVFDQLGHFFSKIVDVCQYQDWHTSDHKPKLFDALLGIAKPHRIFVFDKLIEFDLLDQTFVNLHGSVNYSSPDLFEYDDPKITQHARNNSMSRLPGLANGIGVSHSIPFKIYQNSWYSIVTETNQSLSNFITEKTAKPLFEKKIFVMFGSQGLLAQLHSMGYQTFHGIIDESYDKEPNDIVRWSMAFEQVIKLSKSDHMNVYNTAQPILDYNHQHICNHKYRLERLTKFLDKHLKKLNA
jgi:hypothetical protein